LTLGQGAAGKAHGLRLGAEAGPQRDNVRDAIAMLI